MRRSTISSEDEATFLKLFCWSTPWLSQDKWDRITGRARESKEARGSPGDVRFCISRASPLISDRITCGELKKKEERESAIHNKKGGTVRMRSEEWLRVGGRESMLEKQAGEQGGVSGRR